MKQNTQLLILIQSVIGNNLSIFLLLLGRRKCDNLVEFLCRDWTIYRSVLHAAAEHGHVALLRFLLSKPGLDVNARNQGNNTALHFACYYGHVEAVRMLLAYPGIDIRIRNRVPLFLKTFHLSLVCSFFSFEDAFSCASKSLCVEMQELLPQLDSSGAEEVE